MKTRMLSLGYVLNANLTNYDLKESYELVSAKDLKVIPQSELLNTGVDVGLMRLHIHDAPERRKWLGLREDKNYEILVVFAPTHIHTISKENNTKDVIKVKYGKYFNIEKDESAGGFTYKKMFANLIPKGALTFDVQLTEIDNNKVDPDGLEILLKDTGIGSVLDLAPINPISYIQLASNVINRIQEVFGSDKAGDDPLWNDTLVIEAKPTIPGSYKLREGFYAIVEGKDQFDFSKVFYHQNKLVDKWTHQELAANYLIFSIGKSIKNI